MMLWTKKLIAAKNNQNMMNCLFSTNLTGGRRNFAIFKALLVKLPQVS